MVVTVNEELAKSYIDALYRLHNLGGGKVRREYYATDLARFPDVLTGEKRAEGLAPVPSSSRSCPRWLWSRTVSSSTATLSAKIAASVSSRPSSIWVFWRI